MYCIFVILILLPNLSYLADVPQCPLISQEKLDWKNLDGQWYVLETTQPVQGSCGRLEFRSNGTTTNITLSYVENQKKNILNATSVADNDNHTVQHPMTFNFPDKSLQYTLLDIKAGKYAVLYACSKNNGSSTYDILKLGKSANLTTEDMTSIKTLLSSYESLKNITFNSYNNTKEFCNSSFPTKSISSLILSMLSVIWLKPFV